MPASHTAPTARIVDTAAIICVLLALAGLAGSAATAAAGHSPEQVLARGPQGSSLTATVPFPDGAKGATSRILVVGPPSTTPEAHGTLPGTAVLRDSNQVASTQSFRETSIAVHVTPGRPRTYPVFAFAARELGCASSNMANEPSDWITQVGVVEVSSPLA